MKKINLDAFMQEKDIVKIYNYLEGSFDLNAVLNSKELDVLDVNSKNHLLSIFSKYNNGSKLSSPSSKMEEISLKEFLKITDNKVNK